MGWTRLVSVVWVVLTDWMLVILSIKCQTLTSHRCLKRWQHLFFAHVELDLQRHTAKPLTAANWPSSIIGQISPISLSPPKHQVNASHRSLAYRVRLSLGSVSLTQFSLCWAGLWWPQWCCSEQSFQRILSICRWYLSWGDARTLNHITGCAVAQALC